MRQLVRVVAVAGLVMAAACAPKAEDPAAAAQRMEADAAAARTAIDAANAQYMAHFNAGHADSLAALFAEEGQMMPPNGPTAVGPSAIAAGMAGMAAMKPALALTTVSLEVSGPLAVEAGTYKFTGQPPGAKQPITDSGKYVSHWRKVGDRWMLVHNIWNSDVAAMPMPAGN